MHGWQMAAGTAAEQLSGMCAAAVAAEGSYQSYRELRSILSSVARRAACGGSMLRRRRIEPQDGAAGSALRMEPLDRAAG